MARRVIQRDWECTYPGCNATGRGKPKGKCPECGNKGTLQTVEDELSFGNWWDRQTDARRQELLRAHGSHEAHGGAQQKQKGGGPKKGDQHDVGVARAKEQIKQKYETGEIV